MPRRPGKSLDRQQVVAAAIACIDQDGPSGLGINRVAKHLGVKPPSLYNHVDGGADLALGVLIEASKQIGAAIGSATTPTADPAAQLFAIALSTRAWALEHANLYLTMSQIPPDNEHPEFAAVMAELLGMFREPLRQLGVDGPDAIHAIRGLRATMHGFVLLETGGQFALSADIEDSYRWLIQVTIRGIGATPVT